jgi:hypothetical protein
LKRLFLDLAMLLLIVWLIEVPMTPVAYPETLFENIPTGLVPELIEAPPIVEESC